MSFGAPGPSVQQQPHVPNTSTAHSLSLSASSSSARHDDPFRRTSSNTGFSRSRSSRIPAKATALGLDRSQTLGLLEEPSARANQPLHYCDCGQALDELGAEGARDKEHLRERHLKRSSSCGSSPTRTNCSERRSYNCRCCSFFSSLWRANIKPLFTEFFCHISKQKNWELQERQKNDRLRAESAADAFHKQNIESAIREAQTKFKTEVTCWVLFCRDLSENYCWNNVLYKYLIDNQIGSE